MIVVLAGSVNRYDVRMLQRRHQFRFSFKSRGRLLARHRVPQDLQRDWPLERNLIRQIDHAHRSTSDWTDDFKIA